MTDEELALHQSSLVGCACGKRPCGDNQKCLFVERGCHLYFDKTVETLTAKMECQVCQESHVLRVYLTGEGK